MWAGLCRLVQRKLQSYPMTFHCEVISIKEEFGNTRIVGRIKETTIDDQYIGKDGIPQVRKMNIVWFEAQVQKHNRRQTQ